MTTMLQGLPPTRSAPNFYRLLYSITITTFSVFLCICVFACCQNFLPIVNCPIQQADENSVVVIPTRILYENTILIQGKHQCIEEKDRMKN